MGSVVQTSDIFILNIHFS